MDKKPINEVLKALSYYVREYYKLIIELPHETSITRNVFSTELKERWPIIDREAYFYVDYIEQFTTFLDVVYKEANEVDKVQMLQHFLRKLDTYFSRPGTNNKIETYIINETYPVYLKTNHYWKFFRDPEKYLDRPKGFMHPFSSFGLNRIGYSAKVFDLDRTSEFLHGEKQKADPLQERSQLSIGLFPLSENYKMTFRITEPMDKPSNTWGFISDDTGLEGYQKELDQIADLIISKGIDIACFPELVINDDAFSYLKEKIKNSGKDFFLMIAGSFHRPYKDALYKNTMPVWVYFRDKEFEESYSKLEKFHLPITPTSAPELKAMFKNFDECIPDENGNFASAILQEHIAPDTSLLIIKSERFGNIGFAICKDLLPRNNALIENYTNLADHMFIVSLNNSKRADFNSKGMEIVNEFGVAVYYVNSRHFDPEGASRTYARTPENNMFQFLDPNDVVLQLELKARKFVQKKS